MNPLIAKLIDHFGQYRGQGINHEGEPFIGSFSLGKLLDGRGFSVTFQAQSTKDPSLIFHSETSTIAANQAGGLSLFNLNSNMPFLAEHSLVSNKEETDRIEFIFRFGTLENTNSFREEIKLEIFKDKIGYHYAWGVPGGEFAHRSGAVMQKQLGSLR
jgi:hypothetical protein